MVLMIDTTAKYIGKAISEELLRSSKNAAKFELIDTTRMHISHCVGCNYCWLKTPGVCAIQDDYEPILRKINEADQVWLISDNGIDIQNLCEIDVLENGSVMGMPCAA